MGRTSIKTFTLQIPDCASGGTETHEIRIDGTRTIGELRDAVIDIAQRALGGGRDLSVRVLGLPKEPLNLPISELKLKAPHRVVLLRSPVEGPFPLRGTTPSLPGSNHARQETLDVAEEIRSRGGIDVDHMCILRDADEDAVPWSDALALQQRVQLRVDKYAGSIALAPLDDTKLNLVLDLDHTILDTEVYNAVGSHPNWYRRPYLHEMLSAVFPWYNICVWSATGNAHVEQKLEQLGVFSAAQYKVCNA